MDMRMKRRLLVWSAAIICGTLAVNAQFVGKKAKAERMKAVTENIRKSPSLRTANRIQPAVAEMYYVYDGEVSARPDCWREYDAQGQVVSFRSIGMMEGETITSYYVSKRTYDYSKGYPVLLDDYNYRENAGTHEKTELQYVQRTTMTEGVRTKLEYQHYDVVELDKAGHISRLLLDYQTGSEEERYTWNDDKPISWADIYEEYATEMSEAYKSEIYLTGIQEVYAAVPFNAYSIDVMEALWSGMWLCNATGTYTEDGETVDLVLTGNASDDKKTLTQTIKGGELMDNVITLTYTDDNGSYVLEDKNNSYGDFFMVRETCTFNEMGDQTERVKEEFAEGDVLEYSSKEKMEWEYDNQGRPLTMKSYIWDEAEGYKLNSVLKFTKWHDGSSVSSAVIDGKILGATLYTLDGMKVSEFSAEEIVDIENRVQKGGIYILVKNTTCGTVTEKLIINH